MNLSPFRSFGHFALCAVLAFAALLSARGQLPAPPAAPAPVFQNPLKGDGADPWLTYFDGSYYITWTAYGYVRMRTARDLAELRTAPDHVVWFDNFPTRFRSIWAPECHRLPDERGHLRWFLYYTASDSVDKHHRMYVAESEGDAPLGPYRFKTELRTDPDDQYFAIDGTILALPSGQLYFLWCGRPSPDGQGIYLSKMANAWTLTGPRTYLEVSGFGCQSTREAPETLVHGDKVFLLYSTCDTRTPNYKLGLLTADLNADLLAPTSWRQTAAPAFTSAPEHHVWSPGHCFFFRSPDGKEDWLVYHAKSVDTYTYRERSARAQPFTWNPDGTPDFGAPVPLDLPMPPPSGE